MNNERLKSIIKAYKLYRKDNPEIWLSDCRNSPTLERAIELAATARNNKGQKHDHQNLIPNEILDHFAANVLERLESIKKATSFTELYDIIENCRIKGIGPLTIYDTTHRIGQYLRKEPDKIYLHRGTRDGAKLLLNKKYGKYIDRRDLPDAFQDPDISDADIEDILCMYKDRIEKCL